MLRGILAVIGGLIAGQVVIAGVEWVSSLIYPLPAGVDPGDAAALAAVIATGVPAMNPVATSKDRPAGNGGDTANEETAPPSCVGTLGSIATPFV